MDLEALDKLIAEVREFHAHSVVELAGIETIERRLRRFKRPAQKSEECRHLWRWDYAEGELVQWPELAWPALARCPADRHEWATDGGREFCLYYGGR